MSVKAQMVRVDDASAGEVLQLTKVITILGRP